MRVGIVTTSYPRSADDPAGTFVMGHARWLAAAGHEVDVVAAGDSNESTPPIDGVRVTRVGTGAANLFYSGGAPETLARSRRRWLDAAAFSSALVPRIARHARNWDGIFAHWLAPCALAAAVAAPRTQLVGIAHSGDVHLLRRLRLIRSSARLLRFKRARLAFVTNQLRGLFLKELEGKTKRLIYERSSVCAMGIDVDRFRAASDDACARVPPTILFLGRLVPVKGIPTLIEAVGRLRSSARLVVAGDGPEKSSLLDLSARCGVDVDFIGEIRGRQRDQLIASASVMVLPSTRVEGGRSEGLPVSVLEAMATGVPVIASAVGGLVELPADSVRLVRPDQPAELARAIDEVLSQPASMTAQIGVGHEVAAAHDWSEVGPKLLKMFHRREK